MSNQKQKTLLERVTELEEAGEKNVDAVNALYQQIQKAFQTHMDMVSGLITELGSRFDHADTAPEAKFEAKVVQHVEATRKNRVKAASDQQAAQLQQLVTSGALVTADKLSASSLLVARVTNKEGVVLEPGREQVELQQFNEEMRSKFVGKTLGEQVEMPDGSKVEILEAYELAENLPPAVATPTVTEPAPTTGA